MCKDECPSEWPQYLSQNLQLIVTCRMPGLMQLPRHSTMLQKFEATIDRRSSIVTTCSVHQFGERFVAPMHSMFWIAFSSLQTFATGIVLLNEVALIAAPWITTGPTDFHTSVPLPHQAITALTYACLEPLYTALVAYLGIQPWIHLLNTVHHLWVCLCVIEFLKYLDRMQRQLVTGTATGACFKAKVDTEHQPGKCGQLPLWRPNWQAFFASVVPLHSVAASNAALILFAANLEICMQGDTSAIGLGLHYFGLICYLLSRFGDFLMAQTFSKPIIWPLKFDESLRPYLGCIGILFAVKTLLRWLLGQAYFR